MLLQNLSRVIFQTAVIINFRHQMSLQLADFNNQIRLIFIVTGKVINQSFKTGQYLAQLFHLQLIRTYCIDQY